MILTTYMTQMFYKNFQFIYSDVLGISIESKEIVGTFEPLFTKNEATYDERDAVKELILDGGVNREIREEALAWLIGMSKS